MSDYVIGIDGGNSKTDVVVASMSGQLLARTRGPGVDSPAGDLARWRHELTTLVDAARHQAQVGEDSRAACAAYFLANVDLPHERRVALRELDGAHAHLTVVHNDAVAILRAGAVRPWGVAVVAGAGINAVGMHPNGKIARFLALGDYTGDKGGGHWLGTQAIGAAIRHGDGRGPATAMTKAVADFYGMRRPEDVAVAIHGDSIDYDDLHVLAPLVFAASADGDAVARRILLEFGDEVVTMASALIRRLHLTRTDVEVVLGGGVLQTGDKILFQYVADGITAIAPDAQVRVLTVPPVFGAVVEAFSHVGGSRTSLDLLQATLAA